jgi:hypothetical protein
MTFTRYLVVKGKKFKMWNFQLEEKAFKKWRVEWERNLWEENNGWNEIKKWSRV